MRDIITTASRKLSSDLVKGLKELGHRTNQLEQGMDLPSMALEGHEELDKLNTYLKSLEDAENGARRDNLCIRAESLRPLQTYKAPPLLFFSRNWHLGSPLSI